MNEREVVERAYSMPLTSPAYPKGPYRFVNREFLVMPRKGPSTTSAPPSSALAS
jgi:acetoacetate decarboxylase